jgi:hypothetical protein
MNKERLEQIKAVISEDPRRLNMDWFMVEDDRTHCGSVGCIAGWANKLFDPKHEEWRDQWASGRDLLGLSEGESDRLFSPPEWIDDDNPSLGVVSISGEGAWPDKFAIDYLMATTPEERAAVTCARIDHFIATDGKE